MEISIQTSSVVHSNMDYKYSIFIPNDSSQTWINNDNNNLNVPDNNNWYVIYSLKYIYVHYIVFIVFVAAKTNDYLIPSELFILIKCINNTFSELPLWSISLAFTSFFFIELYTLILRLILGTTERVFSNSFEDRITLPYFLKNFSVRFIIKVFNGR